MTCDLTKENLPTSQHNLEVDEFVDLHDLFDLYELEDIETGNDLKEYRNATRSVRSAGSRGQQKTVEYENAENDEEEHLKIVTKAQQSVTPELLGAQLPNLQPPMPRLSSH